jgi:hypothetical protein
MGFNVKLGKGKDWEKGFSDVGKGIERRTQNTAKSLSRGFSSMFGGNTMEKYFLMAGGILIIYGVATSYSSNQQGTVIIKDA